MLTVALFFFSCEDQISTLGFKNPNQKFNVSYIEIPVKSSIVLLDSIRTSNYYYPGETARFLVGKYQDEKFGNISAAFFSQYFTTTAAKLPGNAVFDSVVMVLRFDLYNYGSGAASPQQISVYELNQELSLNRKNYFRNSDVAVHPDPIGTKSFTINPDDFRAIKPEKDTSIVVRIRLEHYFGDKIFTSAKRWRDVATTQDSVFKTYHEFVKAFKGIAVKADAGDKIVGINPTSTSAIFLHYHADTTKYQLALSFANTTGFNQVKSDRTGSTLAGVTQPYTEYPVINGKTYVQSGTGVFTKLDFSEFFTFADSTKNEIIINSAELVIEDVESSMDPPAAFALRVLNDNNRQKVFSTTREQDRTDVSLYDGLLRFDIAGSQAAVIDHDSVMFVINDEGGAAVAEYSASTKSYRGPASLFLQQLFNKTENKTRYQKFILYPLSPSGAKSLHRAVFPADKIKLKIHYTRPTQTNP